MVANNRYCVEGSGMSIPCMLDHLGQIQNELASYGPTRDLAYAIELVIAKLTERRNIAMQVEQQARCGTAAGARKYH